jgi:hypothetical protein
MSKMTVNISFDLAEDRVDVATIELEYDNNHLPYIHKKAIELAAYLLDKDYTLIGVSSS